MSACGARSCSSTRFASPVSGKRCGPWRRLLRPACPRFGHVLPVHDLARLGVLGLVGVVGDGALQRHEGEAQAVVPRPVMVMGIFVSISDCKTCSSLAML